MIGARPSLGDFDQKPRDDAPREFRIDGGCAGGTTSGSCVRGSTQLCQGGVLSFDCSCCKALGSSPVCDLNAKTCTVDLPVKKDAYTSSLFYCGVSCENTPMGKNDPLNLLTSYYGGQKYNHTYLSFDLSSVQGIQRAWLWLLVTGGDQPSLPVMVRAVNGSWEEEQIIYSHPPAEDSSIASISLIQDKTYRDHEITDLISRCVPPFACTGFKLSTNDGSVTIASKENKIYPTSPPKLRVLLK
jgi:hypothetical protein